MGASEPAQVIEDFIKLFNSGDLDGLVRDMYEDDAVLVPSPGTSATGKAAIREALQGFLSMGGNITPVGCHRDEERGSRPYPQQVADGRTGR